MPSSRAPAPARSATGRSGPRRSTTWSGCAPERWATTLFNDQRRALLADDTLHGPAFGQAYSELVDEWLRGLLPSTDGVALAALGGYGRRELCPYSDLDLLLLHHDRSDVDDVAAQVWYPVWDERISLDHSVRTVRSAVGTAENDVRTGLTMLDARFVAGDPTLVDELRERLARSLDRLARRWLRLLDDMTVTRHQRAGDVAFLLEPDLKDGKGGLRDAAVLRAVGSLLEFITVDDAVSAARDDLLSIRVELHRAVERPLDTLLLQEQDTVGQRLGRGGGDEVMAAVAAAGRRIGWAGDDAWARIRAWIEGPRRTRSGSRPRDLGQGVVRVDDEIAITAGPDGDDDLGRWLHAAAEAAQMDAPFARDTLRRMTGADPRPLPDPWPAPARADFLAMVGAGTGLIPVFDALDHAGLWTELIPEWTTVRNRPQRNAFHRFTVDRHLIEAAVQAAPLTGFVSRPEVLVVAALLHDIGKGSPGDHTDAGIELVATIAPRIGLPPADGHLVQDLVRLHLLLPDTATRRDLDDPKTVALVADAVGSVETLDLLAALTEADARATGPTAWTPWRSGLVAGLVERVRREMEGGGAAVGREPPVETVVDVDPAGGATVIGEGPNATVVAPDRPGLFAAVAGVLALHGLDILGATATSRPNGTAVETFRVQPTIDRSPPWELVQRDLRAVLDGTLALDEHLARRRRIYGDEAAQAAQPPVLDVHFLDHVSDTSTVVDVRGPATLGALYRITRQFAELELDIRHARVTTVGNQAVDSFYVTDAGNQRVTAPGTRRRLAEAIVRDLAELLEQDRG